MAQLLSHEQFKQLRYQNRPKSRLIRDSKAATSLRELFWEGNNDGSKYPKAVWEMADVFKGHKLENFGTHYNNT